MSQQVDQKECCPICGHTFGPIELINICPVQHYGEQEFTPEQLIKENDDYMWVL